MNSLREKIRTIRESMSLLLRQVAAYLEIDTALISKIERGERRLTREQVFKLAKFYNVTDEELLHFGIVTSFKTPLNTNRSQCKD